MFAPFIAFIDKFNKGAWLMVAQVHGGEVAVTTCFPGYDLTSFQATFLYALGPGMAAVFTPNLHEQASIWCLFSMAQVHPPTLHLSRLRTHLNSSSSRSPFLLQIFVMFFVIYSSFNKAKADPKQKIKK